MKNQFCLRNSAGRFLGRLLSTSLTVWALGVMSTPAWAAVTVDQQPLIIQRTLPPNIVLMFDDSGSMANDFMPDWDYLKNNSNNSAVIASANNGTYYNPTVTYLPPVKADGTSYDNATSLQSSWIDGFNQSSGSVDISNYSSNNITYSTGTSSQNYSASNVTKAACQTAYNAQLGAYGNYNWNKNSGSSSNGTCTFTWYKYTYFQFSKGAVNGPYTVYYVAPSDCNGKTNCVIASDTSGVAAPSGIAAGKNIANWFSYYHTRMLMAKSGLMNSFAGLDSTFRVGFGSIDGGNVSGLGSDVFPFTTSVTNSGKTTSYSSGLAKVKPFGTGTSGTQKDAFWKWLVDIQPSGYTPLQQALDFVGQYYQTDDPWASKSSDPDYNTGAASTELACRQSYTILTTDGFWNGNNPATAIGNADNTKATVSGPNGQSYTYSPAAPFNDTNSYTLADVAQYYWIKDLRPNTTNEVPTNTEDPAFWQHMTTFTLGLGFTPTGISPSTTTIDQIFSWSRGGSSIANFSWPKPSSDNINNIADLAHAAVNGHGGFYSATSPEAFTSGLKDALKRATERVGTGASLAANSTQLKTGTVAYQANYYTAKWKGDLKALSIDANTGAIATNPSWTASTALAAYGSRKVYTYNASAVSPASPVVQFTAANVNLLSSAQQTALGTVATDRPTLINYLLGDASREQRNGGTYRNRDTPLGDIVNSQPVYVGAPNANQFVGQTFTGSSAFATYATGKASRTGRVLVAGNDGMLHAFNSSDGTEAWAYLPSAVITNNLKQLSDPNYGGTDVPHQYFNDGELTVADVYFGSPASWHTVVVGTTGRGPAKSVYAIDVTDPTTFKFLWERSASDTLTNSTYIGQMVGKPVIAQTASGSWSVLMGNGYNSSNGAAALLQFAITDGTLSVHGTSDSSTGNGLAAPAVWIGDATNGVSTVAYAGDAKGQVWKFQLNDGTAATPSSTGSLVFTAKDGSNNAQPITAGMLMGRDPATSNIWLFFGTGKYLATADLSSTATQTWYGLIVQSSNSTLVSNLASNGRGALVERDILVETAGDSAATPPLSPGRAVTPKPTTSDLTDKSGWYMDLTSPLNGAEGERMVTPNQFQGSLLLGTTRIPLATDACNPSGRGWIMAMDPFTGTAPSASFFDLNGNGAINSADSITSDGKTYSNSGIGFSSLPNNPIFVGGVMLVSFDNGSNGSVYTAGSQGTFERVSWRELITP